MNTKNTGGPAFPVLDFVVPGIPATNQNGMTLRDYFAAKAMQSWFPVWERTKDFDLASHAYSLADAMIRARES